MAKPIIDPLQWNAAIVNPQTGFPTEWFMRQFSVQRANAEELAQLFTIEFIAGVGLSGGGVLGDLDDITFNLEDTAVTPGAYGAAPASGTFKSSRFTVDQQGRLTAAGESTIDMFIDREVFIAGKPTNGQIVLRIEIGRACTFPINLSTSQASARVASTSNKSFDIKKNGSSIGSVVFNVSASGTFTFASATSFAAGDLLELIAPATADATLEDISITLVATR